MQRFLLGLVVGALVGGGGVYAALEKPWASATAESTDVAPDAGPAVATRGKKKKRARKRAPAGDQPVVLTAADRKLSWKGDKVALPAREVDLAAGGDGRPLSGEEINRVIKDRSRTIVSCITSAAGAARFESPVTLKLLVDGGGRVTRVRVRAAAYLFAHGLHGCVRKAARGLTFPATGAHTVVTAPFDLF